MALRPVFFIQDNKVEERNVEFQWFAGFAVSQKQKCIRSLHETINKVMPGAVPLEISTKSEVSLGRFLSAFNLHLDGTFLENAFQSSKVFEQGGPYQDLLKMNPRDAKRDPRLKESGKLTGFRYGGHDFPLQPLTAFYDYIYLKAVLYSKVPYEKLKEYNAFTDIEFNPKRSINTQARSVATIRLMLDEGIDIPQMAKEPDSFVAWHKSHVIYADR
ncbi:MAG: DUF6977 family protein [Bilifractor sp.]